MEPNRHDTEGMNLVGRAPGVIMAEVDGDVVLMSLEEGCYFGLDDISSDIWRRIERNCTFAQLVEGLVEDYDAPHNEIESGVRRLLHDLAEHGLVVLS